MTHRWWGAVLVLVAAAAYGHAFAQERPESSRVDPSRLVPSADTFAMIVGDDTVATQIVSLQRTEDGFLFREETRGRFGRQETEVRISPTGGMLSVRQRGEAGGRAMSIDVTYATGRAEGHAVTPGPSGVQTLSIDAAVPPNVIDDNVLISLLPALRLEPGRTLALPVFASGQNALVEYVIGVREADPVAVAGVEHEALLARATSASSIIDFVVTRASPHRVLRIEPPGPVRVVRIG